MQKAGVQSQMARAIGGSWSVLCRGLFGGVQRPVHINCSDRLKDRKPKTKEAKS